MSLAEAVELGCGVGRDLHHLVPVGRDLGNVGEVGAAVALHIAATGQQVSVSNQLLCLVTEQEVHKRLGVVHVGGSLEDHGRAGIDHRAGSWIVDVQGLALCHGGIGVVVHACDQNLGRYYSSILYAFYYSSLCHVFKEIV